MSHNVYFAKLFAYLSIGIRYLFYGILEFVVKFFVLILKDPHEGYKILTAPIEKIEAKEEELLKSEHFERFKRVHKKTRLASFATLLGSSVAVLAISFLISFVSPERQDTFAASYTWTQSDWTGGATSNTASDPANRTGWTEYTSTTTGMIATTSVSLLATPQNFIDSTNPTRPTGTSGGDFDLGTNNNTIVLNGNIQLAGVDPYLDPEVYTQLAGYSGYSAAYSGGNVLTYDGGDFIYYIQAYTSTFGRYSISSNSWTTLPNTPALNDTGSSIAYANGNVYFLPGYGKKLFYRYSISAGSWTRMTDIPQPVGPGGAMVYPGFGDYIYVVTGRDIANNVGTPYFYRYSISANSWTRMADVPMILNWEETDMAYNSTDGYIYLRRATSDMYKYSISTDTWTQIPNSAPPVTLRGGMAYDGLGYFYEIGGASSNVLYRYSVSSNTWEQRPNLPFYLDSNDWGSDVLYVPGGKFMYIIPGTGTFWRLQIFK